jgi:hypothetical protein
MTVPARVVGGAAEMYAGAAYTYATGGLGGWLGGGTLVANGADNFQAGWNSLRTGSYQQAYLEKGITSVAGNGALGDSLYVASQLGIGFGAPALGSKVNGLLEGPGKMLTLETVSPASPLKAPLVQAELRLSAFEQLSTPQITVIGASKDTGKHIGRAGFNILNVPDDAFKVMTSGEFDRLNALWFNSALQRGDAIWLLTDPHTYAAQLLAKYRTTQGSRYFSIELPMLEEFGVLIPKPLPTPIPFEAVPFNLTP